MRRPIALAALAVTLGAAAPAAAATSITATPGLRPSFASGARDHVSACRHGRPLRVQVNTAHGSTVSIDGRAPRGGSFTATVSLGTGQATAIAVHHRGHTRHDHVRCLPAGFPRYRFERDGRPRAQWYLIAPSEDDGTAARSRFVALIDGHGTPVWWKLDPQSPFNAVPVGGREIAWTRWFGDPFGTRPQAAWEIHRLDGSLVRVLRTAGSPADTHDMEPLPNGHFLLDTYRRRSNVQLAPYGGSGTGDVVDGEIQEIDRRGDVLWSWNSKDHIRPSETTHLQSRLLPDGHRVWDVFHLNSVEPDGDGYVISSRNTDAVYRIDRITGDVTWKLGGTRTARGLKVHGDPLSPHLQMQHDARVQPDGTLTVFDNRTGVGAPRGVRFRIDAARHSARLLGQVTDPKAPESSSEGSARRIAGGHWVVSWGGTPVMSELTGTGRLVWRLKLRGGLLNYRVTPIPFGTWKPSRLRRAMDAMFPR